MTNPIKVTSIHQFVIAWEEDAFRGEEERIATEGKDRIKNKKGETKLEFAFGVDRRGIIKLIAQTRPSIFNVRIQGISLPNAQHRWGRP